MAQFDVYLWDHHVRNQILFVNIGLYDINKPGTAVGKRIFGEGSLEEITKLRFVLAGIDNSFRLQHFMPENGEYAIDLLEEDLGIAKHDCQVIPVWEYLSKLYEVLRANSPEKNPILFMSLDDYNHLGRYCNPQKGGEKTPFEIGGI
jgi:hypothetical protein